ncbi:MAG: hypothetical protein J6E38_00830 [Clostridia bacterium]|nr:hypothetical protein [Clostridia bacterium]
METEPLVKETDSRLLYNSLAKKNNANAENTAKNEIKPPETSLYSNRSKENLPKNGVRFKANLQNNLSQQGKAEVSSRTQPTSGIRFKAETSGNNGTKTPIYSGDIWDNEPQEDLFSNDIPHKDLYGFFTPSDNENTAKWQKRILPFFKDFKINANDLLVPETVHIASLRNLGNLSSCSNKDMNKVANQLIDHFLSGTGNDFSSVEFTKAVGEHKQTQRYMDDFTKTFKEALSSYNGNVSEIVNSKSFNDTLKKTKCYCHNTIIVISKIYLEDIHSLFIHGPKVMFR